MVILVSIFSVNTTMSDKCSLIFIHIPKTGGTSITEVCAKRKIPWKYPDDNSVDKCGCRVHHLPPTSKIKEYGKPIFAVVRNPYTRAISEYKYKNKKTSVSGLNLYIEKCLSDSSKNQYAHGCHWMPQYLYTKYCDHILYFENLDQEFSDLMTKYDLDYKLPKRNVSKGVKLTISDISFKNIKSINIFFKQDFEQFKYRLIKDAINDNNIDTSPEEQIINRG